MDFSDISSDLPDIMTTTSDDDIPNLEDILDSAHLDNSMVCIKILFDSPNINNTQDYVYFEHTVNIVYTIKTGHLLDILFIMVVIVEVRVCILP